MRRALPQSGRGFDYRSLMPDIVSIVFRFATPRRIIGSCGGGMAATI
jgi:hypothetical protein